MEVKRNIADRKLYIIENGEVVLETDHIGGEFVVCIRTHNPIRITREIDDNFFSSLKELISNDYLFDGYGLSYKQEQKIVWFSDQYCDIENEKDRKRINRLILEDKGDEVQISFENPLMNELGRKKKNNFISFSPGGNGAFSKNINSGLTFQDDIVILFENTLNYESNDIKKKKLSRPTS
ncbi:MAG: hypothetical protein J6A52_02265 [Bacilli bacterium]|nr:hypothetical protein [Bacilli bacterium]